MTQKPKAKMNIPMCAACILFCLTLFSIHLTGGLYAKYTAKGTGSDEARVAKFEVVTMGDGDVAVQFGAATDNEYEFTVTNQSEVAVEYTITVTNLSSMGVTTVLDSDSGALEANTGAKSHVLTFTVDDWSKIGALLEDKTVESPVVPIDFTVTIDVEQID